MNRQKANLMCLLVALIWGGGFVATNIALETFNPLAMLVLRFGFAALLGWIPVFFRHEKVSSSAIKTGMLSGVLLYVAFAFQTFGMDYTTAGMNAFLTSVNVVVVPFIVWIIWHQKPEPIVFAASLLCLAGIGCLSLSSGCFQFGFGDLLSLICAFFFAAQIVSLDRANGESPLVINAIQLTMAAICSIPFGLMTKWPSSVSMEAIWSIVYSVVLSTFVCYLMQTTAQQYTSAAAASILLGTESLWANLFSFLFLHEAKTPIMIFGGLLIFVSVLLVESGNFIEGHVKSRKFRKTCPQEE